MQASTLFSNHIRSTMESSWSKRGYGSAISRSVEVWIFGLNILFKEVKLRKVPPYVYLGIPCCFPSLSYVSATHESSSLLRGNNIYFLVLLAEPWWRSFGRALIRALSSTHAQWISPPRLAEKRMPRPMVAYEVAAVQCNTVHYIQRVHIAYTEIIGMGHDDNSTRYNNRRINFSFWQSLRRSYPTVQEVFRSHME